MRVSRILGALVALGVAFGVGSAAAEPQADPQADPALTELVQILKNQGVLDEAEYTHLTAKAAKQEEKQSWTDRITLWGDLRGRYEGFFYTGDDDDVPDRSRLRYRLRLNGKAEINSRAQVLFRIASGSDDNRSTNQTLGNDPDFASDAIWIDRAYVRISPFVDGLLPGEGGTAWIEFGKVPNPYVWKHGKDFMLWDHDINLEGANVLFENDISDRINVFASTGYYVVDELSSHADPNLVAGQVGGHFRLADGVTAGTRVSYFRFGDMNEAEIGRGVDGTDGVTSGGGNIVDGLTGDPFGGSMNVIESGVYLDLDLIESWPITLYANVSSNLSAESSDLFPQAGREDLAWGVGGEIGDKKKWLKLGIGYWQIEANAFPSQFIDSDLFDGYTNRKGFAFYGSRQILENTDLNITALLSDPIDDSLPAFADSVAKAERVRIQADMIFKF